MANKKYVDDCGGLKPIVIPRKKNDTAKTKTKTTATKKKVKRK